MVKVLPWAEGQSGSTVDWDEYDLTQDDLPLYRKAKFINGEWLFPYDNYMVENVTIGKMAQTIENIVNPADWRLMSITSNGTGMVILAFTRRTVHKLAMPVKLTDIPPLPLHNVAEEDVAKWMQSPPPYPTDPRDNV